MASAILAGPTRISFRLNGPDKASNWPASERVPKTIQQALEWGWELGDESWSESDDQRTRVGTIQLNKTVQGLCLELIVPYRATLEFGQLRRK